MSDRFHSALKTEYAQIGRVMSASNSGIGISANLDAKTNLQVAPYGVYAKPSAGDLVLLLPTSDGAYVSLPVVETTKNLNAGELLLQAASGAFVHLKSDGTVQINDTVIKATNKAQ